MPIHPSDGNMSPHTTSFTIHMATVAVPWPSSSIPATPYTIPTPKHQCIQSDHQTRSPILPRPILLLRFLHSTSPNPTRLLRCSRTDRFTLCPRLPRTRELIPKVLFIFTRTSSRSAKRVPEIFLLRFRCSAFGTSVVVLAFDEAGECCAGGGSPLLDALAKEIGSLTCLCGDICFGELEMLA